MQVAPTNNTTHAKPIAAGDSKAPSDFDMYLKMLTAQMKNQDPLNPIDSADYATQLATFSGVEQQVKTNQLLETLVGDMGLSGLAQLAPWVGMNARSAASVAFDGSPVTLYPNPAKDADKLILVAYDDKNREVSREEIPVSSDPVTWSGKNSMGGTALTGNYSFKLESLKAGKLIADDPVEAYGKVVEVRQSDKGAILVLESGATVLPSEIKALRPPTRP